MAGVAFRDVSVPISMAVRTGHIRRMLAGILLELIALLTVTKGAGRRDLTHRDHKRLVRISMAVQARGQVLLFSVKGPPTGTLVAPGTIGHNGVVVLFSRIVNVVLPVATHTVDLMLATRLLDRLEDRVMTLATFCRCQGFDVRLIGGHSRRSHFPSHR